MAALARMLWRLVVAAVMAALAAFFASWSGGMAAEALNPYDSSWHLYAMVAVVTAILGGLSIAMASYCRSRRAVAGLVVFCVGTWLGWAGCATFIDAFESTSAAQQLLLVGSVVGAAALVVALALPNLVDGDGR